MTQFSKGDKVQVKDGVASGKVGKVKEVVVDEIYSDVSGKKKEPLTLVAVTIYGLGYTLWRAPNQLKLADAEEKTKAKAPVAKQPKLLHKAKSTPRRSKAKKKKAS